MRTGLVGLVLLGCGGGDGDEERGGNAAPGPLAIEIHPANPTAADDLTVDVVIPSEDPEGKPVEYLIEWYVDGELLNGVDTMTLESMFTVRGERWSVLVTAFDGVLEGGQAMASVDIVNSEPTIDSIVVMPAEVREKSEVTCEYSEPVDLDNDVIQQTQVWSVNGAELDIRGSLFGTDFRKGDELACVVYADDGVGDAVPHISAPVVVLNTEPYVIGCSLHDNEPLDNAPIDAVSEGFVDEDNDPEGYLYQWYVNGAPVSTDASLTTDKFNAGDNVYVECTAWDGEQAGNTAVSGHGIVQASG
ncbi:MAG: hypothetical protein VX944_16165 [Myxococcota bacterium]|nr:hypothetical protein [Myxococcota bacterium]